MNKLFRILDLLTPRFLTRIDAWLVTRHPLLWSSRFVHVLFYTLSTLLIFEALIYLIPLQPTIIFVPLYISYISLVFGCVGLGIWLYSQSQYNIWRSYGKSTRSYSYRYTLTYILLLILFISCACLPCWNAAKRAYNYILDDEVHRVIQASSEKPKHYSHIAQLQMLPSKHELDNAQANNPDRLQHMQIEMESLAKKQVDKGLSSTDREQAKARIENLTKLTTELDQALKQKEPRFWVLYKQFFTANVSDWKKTLSPSGAPDIIVNGHRYQEYISDEYNYYESPFYYRDEHKNFLQYSKFINWVILENIAKKLFSSDFTSLIDVAYGDNILKTNEPQRFFRTLTDLSAAPDLFSLSETSARDYEIIIILLQLLFAFMLALTLAATLSSFFGIKAFFINLTFMLFYSTAMVVIFSIIDQTSKHLNDEEIIFLVFATVILVACLALFSLYRSRQRRIVHGFLWLLSSFSLPFAIIISLLILLAEVSNIDIDDPTGIIITTVALLICAFWYLPSQMRLLYRIYSLPK